MVGRKKRDPPAMQQKNDSVNTENTAVLAEMLPPAVTLVHVLLMYLTKTLREKYAV